MRKSLHPTSRWTALWLVLCAACAGGPISDLPDSFGGGNNGGERPSNGGGSPDSSGDPGDGNTGGDGSAGLDAGGAGAGNDCDAAVSEPDGGVPMLPDGGEPTRGDAGLELTDGGVMNLQSVDADAGVTRANEARDCPRARDARRRDAASEK